MAYSSNVLELLGDLMLMMAAWWAQHLLLLCKLSLLLRYQACDFTTSDNQSSVCGRISSHTNAPPSALTTAFACSRAWSIIIGENCQLNLCTITFQFRTPEPSEAVSVKSYCLCRGQEYIVHNLHCFWQIRMVSVRSVIDSTDLNLPSRIIRSTRGLLTSCTRAGFSSLSVFSLTAVVRIGFTESCIMLLGISAGC